MYGYRCPRYISRDFEIDRVRNTSRAIQKFHVCSSGRQCASFSPDRVREIEQNCWNQWSSFVQSLKIVTSGEKTLAYVPRANFDKIRIKPMVKLLFRDDRMAKFFKLKYKCVGKLNSLKKKKNIYIYSTQRKTVSACSINEPVEIHSGKVKDSRFIFKNSFKTFYRRVNSNILYLCDTCIYTVVAYK